MSELLHGSLWLAAAFLLGIADELYRARRLRRGGDAPQQQSNQRTRDARGEAGSPQGGPAPFWVGDEFREGE